MRREPPDDQDNDEFSLEERLAAFKRLDDVRALIGKIDGPSTLEILREDRRRGETNPNYLTK